MRVGGGVWVDASVGVAVGVRANVGVGEMLWVGVASNGTRVGIANSLFDGSFGWEKSRGWFGGRRHGGRTSEQHASKDPNQYNC